MPEAAANAPKPRKHCVSAVFLAVIHRSCYLHDLYIARKGECEGEPLRVPPLAFNRPPAGDHFCAAKVQLHQNKSHPSGGFCFGGARATVLEPRRSSCCGTMSSSELLYKSKRAPAGAGALLVYHVFACCCDSAAGSQEYESRHADQGGHATPRIFLVLFRMSAGSRPEPFTLPAISCASTSAGSGSTGFAATPWMVQ